MKITAKEMDIIKSALLYAAEQVHSSDIPVFETYEDRDCIAGKVSFSEERYAINEAKATLAEELVMKLDASHDWDCTSTDYSVLEVFAYWEELKVFACEGSCWLDIGDDQIVNLATGELRTIVDCVADRKTGQVTWLYTV